MATLSPRKRSCVSYSNLEPCVNKAIQNLLILKQDLHHGVVWKPLTPDSQADLKSSTINISEDDTASYLSVRGRASNLHFQITPEQDKYSEFIEGALFLILRLDKDTRETTMKLDTVKEKVCTLRKTLDAEAVRRMILLREAVQEGDHIVIEWLVWTL